MDNNELKNRFTFHPANTESKQYMHGLIRTASLNLALLVNENAPEGREKSLAITKIEEGLFWANAAIARAGDSNG